VFVDGPPSKSMTINGLDGTVSSYEPSTKRFAIQIAVSKTMIAVKRENLEVKDEAEDPTALCRTIIAQRIGADAAELVSSFLNCTRCLEPCAPGSMCRIPHPIHLRQDLGMMSRPDGMRASYRCQACRQQVILDDEAAAIYVSSYYYIFVLIPRSQRFADIWHTTI
jgi:hypothetical protein